MQKIWQCDADSTMDSRRVSGHPINRIYFGDLIRNVTVCAMMLSHNPLWRFCPVCLRANNRTIAGQRKMTQGDA
jgi:hypothetical protein